MTPRSIYVLPIALLLFLASCSKKSTDVIAPPPPPPPNPGQATDNDPLVLGNPTNAQTSVSFPTNYLKNNTFYKIAYHSTRGIPVWVGWHLESGDMGSTPRQDDFRADLLLPAGWYQVQDNSYTGSGFDRGHNCPSADRTSTVAANSSTFLMTNIIPQAPKLNQGPWAGLEDHTRTLVGTTKEAFIFMGNHGEGGYNYNNLYYTSIDNGNVTVPEMIWKVVILIPKGNNDLSRVDSNATVIAVNMPNDNRLYSIGGSGNSAWRNYITSITSLEQEANAEGVPLNLLKSLPEGVRNFLKAKIYQ